ncbi:MAG: transporter substrate-binding domain-containing protein [Clostridia bacterium]|nr:transporter substrate-binding domain-containing protein [Clostridia bacterium]MBQ8973365.1 transporter substrate-binding domain-containing protein [Clostridia bacterium]
MKKIALIALVLVLTLSCAALAEPFRVGLECNYAPFNWTQVEADELSVPIDGGMGYAGGYDVEIAKRIADGLGRELVIVKTEWDGLIPALQSGMIDAIIAGMSPTAERKLTVAFSDAYYNSDLVIVVRKDSEYANATQLSDFSGAKITGQLNTFHYTVIDQIEGVQKMTAMETFPAMIVALSSGVIDGYVSERPGAVSACASNDDLTFISFESGFEASEEDTSIAVALRQSDEELREQINAILAEIGVDERNELMDAAVLNQPAAE